MVDVRGVEHHEGDGCGLLGFAGCGTTPADALDAVRYGGTLVLDGVDANTTDLFTPPLIQNDIVRFSRKGQGRLMADLSNHVG